MSNENRLIILAIALCCIAFVWWISRPKDPYYKRAREHGYEYAKDEYIREPTQDTLDRLELESLTFAPDSKAARQFDQGIRDFLREKNQVIY
ncbi:hypothetical protein ACJCFO_002879 [Acinetobacter baumannii]|nr:hypothetical protein [Acinetobacter baumannii]EKU8237893.1 hypothetical protein [Acinetobacter baumannii]EKU8309819.1 hypothetical protein [Acinetobacter baumannii]EKU8413602.1 hypothetical protein [Acinetobacter baumannii]EKU9263392.1 hypothetical protein [Acinetobacter baumannii]